MGPPSPQRPGPPPQFADFDVQRAGATQRGMSEDNFGATILTGGQGLSAPVSTTKKVLIGQ